MKSTFPFDYVLQLSCSAFRMNGGIYSLQNSGVNRNSEMIKQTLGLKEYDETQSCEVTEEDIEFAKNLTIFFQRLSLDVLGDRYVYDKKYERETYNLMLTGLVKSNKITHIAKLPGFSFKYLAASEIQKVLPSLQPEFISDEGKIISNIECQIITQTKCTNYPGFNVYGIINNRMVTWYSNKIILEDIIVIEHAVIKENGNEWFTGVFSSRLGNVNIK